MTEKQPAWMPTTEQKRHADAGCAHEWRDGQQTGCRVWQPSDGDTRCQQCGAENPCWFAPNELWNEVVGGEGGVLCPTCFMLKSDRIWRITTAPTAS